MTTAICDARAFVCDARIIHVRAVRDDDDDDDVNTRGARCAVRVESARGDGDGDGGAPIETIRASSAVDFIAVVDDVKVLRIASGATHDDAHERASGASGAHRVALRLARAHGGGDRTGVLGVRQSNLLV